MGWGNEENACRLVGHARGADYTEQTAPLGGFGATQRDTKRIVRIYGESPQAGGAV